MALIKKEQMWKRFKTLAKDKPVNCEICKKEIYYGEDGVEYVKTKRGTEIFVHTACIGKW